MGARPSRSSPRDPATLGALVAAVAGCCTAAEAFSAPFVSGKDSLNNTYTGTDGRRHAVPPTLVDHRSRPRPRRRPLHDARTRPPRQRLLLLGDTGEHFAGSHLDLLTDAHRTPGPSGRSPPQLDPSAPARYRALHQAIRAGLVAACHDVSEGGLAVALAEMCIASSSVSRSTRCPTPTSPRRCSPSRPAASSSRSPPTDVDASPAIVGPLTCSARVTSLDPVLAIDRVLRRRRRRTRPSPSPGSAVVSALRGDRRLRPGHQPRPRRRARPRVGRRHSAIVLVDELTARPGPCGRGRHRRHRRRVQLRRRARRWSDARPRCQQWARRAPRRGPASLRCFGPPDHRHLQRVPGPHPGRTAAGRPRPQRRRPLRVPVGTLAKEPGSRCIWTKHAPDLSTARSPTAKGRYVHPDPDALAAGGQVALRYAAANPNGSVDDIAGVCDDTGSSSG